jgi:hypothetical protein
MAFQLDTNDRNRIKTIIQKAYDINKPSQQRYDADYLEIVIKILSTNDTTSLNKFIESYDFYIHYYDNRYHPFSEWLLEQVPTTDFGRLIQLTRIVYQDIIFSDYITWVRKQFHRRMDVSLIDKALYDMFVSLIEKPSTDLRILEQIIVNSTATGIADLHKLVDEKQSKGRTEFMTKIKGMLCFEDRSLCGKIDYPSYFPDEEVQSLFFTRFLFGLPVDENWVKDLLVKFPVGWFDDEENLIYTPDIFPPESNDKNDNEVYSQVLSVAPYTALMTPLQEKRCIDILLQLLIYIRTKKLSIPCYDLYNVDVAERTYIALLKLVPKMSPEQSVQFEETVLEDLRSNTAHTQEITDILFTNRGLIGEKLANRLVDFDSLNSKNTRLIILMRAQRYTCTASDLTNKVG